MKKENVTVRELNTTEVIGLKKELSEAMIESNEINFPTCKNFNVNERFTKLLDYMSSGTARIAAAFVELNFCGYIWFFSKTEKRFHLNEIAVLEHYRGMHVGTKLIKYLEDVAVSEQVEEIELFCMENNTVAQKFYNNNQFYTEKKLLVRQLKETS